MKITKIAKPGKIMKQPPKNPNSGKLDSQIFIGKEVFCDAIKVFQARPLGQAQQI